MFEYLDLCPELSWNHYFFIFSRLVSTQHFDCCDYKYRCRRHHRPRCTKVDTCKVAISSCTADQIIGDTNRSHDNRTSMYGWKNMLWKGRGSKMVQVEIVIYHRHSSRSLFSLKTGKRVGCIVSFQVGSFWLFFFFPVFFGFSDVNDLMFIPTETRPYTCPLSLWISVPPQILGHFCGETDVNADLLSDTSYKIDRIPRVAGMSVLSLIKT